MLILFVKLLRRNKWSVSGDEMIVYVEYDYVEASGNSDVPLTCCDGCKASDAVAEVAPPNNIPTTNGNVMILRIRTEIFHNESTLWYWNFQAPSTTAH